MSQTGSGQDLGVGDHRRQQSPPANEFSNRCVGGVVEGVLPIEKADDDAGVEDYRHSPRSPSTRSRKSPPVSRHPE